MLSHGIKLIILLFLIIAVNSVEAAPIDLQIKKMFNSIPKEKGCKYFITSGHRTVEKNNEVGGAKNSLHLSDRARDIGTNCRMDIINIAAMFGLTVIIYKTHLHLDNRNGVKCLVKIKSGYRYCNKNDYKR